MVSFGYVVWAFYPVAKMYRGSNCACMQGSELGMKGPLWSHLPAELVRHLCGKLASTTKGTVVAPYATAKTLLRSCCRDWWLALPIGRRDTNTREGSARAQ